MATPFGPELPNTNPRPITGYVGPFAHQETSTPYVVKPTNESLKSKADSQRIFLASASALVSNAMAGEGVQFVTSTRPNQAALDQIERHHQEDGSEYPDLDGIDMPSSADFIDLLEPPDTIGD